MFSMKFTFVQSVLLTQISRARGGGCPVPPPPPPGPLPAGTPPSPPAPAGQRGDEAIVSGEPPRPPLTTIISLQPPPSHSTKPSGSIALRGLLATYAYIFKVSGRDRSTTAIIEGSTCVKRPC